KIREMSTEPGQRSTPVAIRVALVACFAILLSAVIVHVSLFIAGRVITPSRQRELPLVWCLGAIRIGDKTLVAAQRSSRIQVYDEQGHFLYGWQVPTVNGG